MRPPLHAGAESTWNLELPSALRQFDYNTISDVVLHVRYTARQGGGQLRTKAAERIEQLVGAANTSGLVQLFSLKHDFPSEWHRFVTGDENLEVTVIKEYLPYLVQGKDLVIDKVELHAIQGNRLQPPVAPNGIDENDLTDLLRDEGEFEMQLAPDGAVLTRENESLVFLLLKYSIR